MARIEQKLLKINGIVFANPKEYSIQYDKLWANAGRNLAGRLSATLTGIYPKIKVKTTIQEKERFATLASVLQRPQFQVEYYDFIAQTVKSGMFYASDFEIKLFERERGLIEEVSVNLIPYDNL